MTELNTEYLKTVGARVRALREAKGITQDELATELGMVRTGVVKFEMGAQDFKSETIAKLSDYFGVTADYLLRGASSGALDVFRYTGLTQASLDTLADEKNVNDALFDGEWGRIEVVNELLSDSEYHYLIGEFAIFRYQWRRIHREIKDGAKDPDVDEAALRERADFLHWQFTQKTAKYLEKLLGEK